MRGGAFCRPYERGTSISVSERGVNDPSPRARSSIAPLPRGSFTPPCVGVAVVPRECVQNGCQTMCLIGARDRIRHASRTRSGCAPTSVADRKRRRVLTRLKTAYQNVRYCRSDERFSGSAWARQDCPRSTRRFAVLTRPARSLSWQLSERRRGGTRTIRWICNTKSEAHRSRCSCSTRSLRV